VHTKNTNRQSTNNAPRPEGEINYSKVVIKKQNGHE